MYRVLSVGIGSILYCIDEGPKLANEKSRKSREFGGGGQEVGDKPL